MRNFAIEPMRPSLSREAINRLCCLYRIVPLRRKRESRRRGSGLKNFA